MESAATTTNSGWSTASTNPSLDHMAMMAQGQALFVQGQPDSNSASQSILGGFKPDHLATSPPDANSVLRLQQNLQRLYGSLGQLQGSRSSLPDIQEEGPTSAQLASQPIATPALQVPMPGRSTSEDDLFRMDPAPQANGIAPAIGNTLADLSLVGQMPSDGAESRTLFVRGVDPTSSDADLKELFDCFGDVRAMYTACKHRGMVVISYHDIRAATLAHHTLHGQDVKGRTFTCQFTKPKDSSEAASGTLLVFTLNTAQSRQDLFYILSKYGELRELKDDPLRPNCCVVEYYDARHAAGALTGIAQSPETSGRILAIDAGSLPSNGSNALTGTSASMAQPEIMRNASSPALGNLGATAGSSSQLDATLLMGGNTAGYLHQPDLAGMTRSLSEMSLDNSGLFGSTARLPATSFSANDLSSMPGTRLPAAAALNGLRGAASTGSLWTQAGVSLGSSPLGGSASGVWPASHPSLAALQQEQQVAYLQQQQQNALVQTAAMQAALQQALLVQQAQQQAAAMVRNPIIGGGIPPRRGFSEPSLGGRLARRPADPLAEAERRAQQERLYSLDLVKIMAGEDKRTTLMIKNIPNKYTQKMLLALIEEQFKGTFDFFYLPIDFKNRCNVGYAFINMVTPTAIPPLVKEFHGKRWPKFNSEKICHVAYARIQGKNALVQHFQNSSLLHEDKRCRPVLFKSDSDGGEAEAFPLGPAPTAAGEQQ